jgi:serine/threonine-protein kinase
MIPSWLPTRSIKELLQYDDFKKIAEGGFGETYSATHHQKTKKIPVIVKRLKPLYLNNPLKRESFEQDARFLKAIHHPQIPKFMEGYLSEEECFFIMEAVHGLPLDALLSRANEAGSKLPLELFFDIAIQSSQVISDLHHFKDESGRLQPILHCDVKPHNILVTPEGKVYLIDFSVATHWITGKLHKGGTYRYMPPERFAGEAPSPQTDIFGLTLTFFQILTLRPLAQGKTLYEIFTHYLSKKYVEDIHQENLPKPIEDILMKGLAYQPEERFDSAEALMNALKKGAHTMKVVIETLHPELA